jgi:transcriptional regulator with PAS, ATPase and Fis domain
LVTAVEHGTETIDLIEWKDAFAEAMVGESRSLLEQIRVAKRVADTECTVLITGETGTGKELMAQAIHSSSARSSGPFVAVNCAAIPDDLIEDELFGHIAGAFSGAVRDRAGKVVRAQGGTLFLDEVGELPARAQAKLLRMLQERVVTPIGSDEPTRVDVRIVAATHRDLMQMVRAGTFREDLLYRLNVIPIDLPPLRSRGPDILAIAMAFLRVACERFHRSFTGFTPAAERALIAHSWPGNVRELKNAIDRAVLLANGPEIDLADLGKLGELDVDRGAIAGESGADLDLKKALRKTELELIEKALEKAGGNRTEAAALLGLNRTTLVEKLKKGVAP